MTSKIDFYVIPPFKHLELMDFGDRYFCLAQLYKKDEKYREFFKERVNQGKWVTLDNGVGDHDFISQDELFEIMKDLNPSEVIPLDVLFNVDQTVKNTVEFVERMKKEGLNSIEILSVPQGNTFNEWVSCYKQLSEIEEVKTLGMSKIGIPWAVSQSKGDVNIGCDRNFAFSYLKKNGLLKKQLHFLGAGEPDEFLYYKNEPTVRSTDSCFTVWSGMNQVLFNSDYKRIPTPRDYFDRKINSSEMEYVLKNIRIFRELLND